MFKEWKQLCDFVNLWVLCFVWMFGSGVGTEFSELSASQSVVWDHAADGALDDELWLALAKLLGSLDFLAANVTRVAGVNLLRFLVSSKDHFVCVDDDDVVTCIDVWGEDGLVLATEEACGLDGNLTEHFVGGIDDIPLALDVGSFGRKCFHGRNGSRG